MPQELPYLPSYKNVGALFQKIQSAKIPEAFTHQYLRDILGFKSTSDRPLITLLKTLGFIDNAGKPTPRYAALKNEKVAGIEIARGIQEAYGPLFSADESAHKLDSSALKGLIAQVAGADAGITGKILGTFKALVSSADFASDALLKEDAPPPADKPGPEDEQGEDTARKFLPEASPRTGMRPEFHYNIQVHLPTNGAEETYMNIFNAIRKVFR